MKWIELVYVCKTDSHNFRSIFITGVRIFLFGRFIINVSIGSRIY